MTSYVVNQDNFFYAFYNRAKQELRLIYEVKMRTRCFVLKVNGGFQNKMIFHDYDLSGFDELGRKVVRDLGIIRIYDDR